MWEFNVKNYSLDKTLLSGQAFRLREFKKGYIGIIFDSVVYLEKTEQGINAEIISGDISKKQLTNYLGLSENYEDIIEEISVDEYVKYSIDRYSGYRILNQPLYETLISFIDSANNCIRNIRMQMENLARMFGEKILDNYYSFPAPETIAELTEKQIMEARVGYRGKYMIESSQLFLSQDLEEGLKDLDSTDAVHKLSEFPGVGNKVADCVLLFSQRRLERVPVDVWTRRIYSQIYGLDENSKYQEIQDFALDKFGRYAGYASSFLFEAGRSGDLDKISPI